MEPEKDLLEMYPQYASTEVTQDQKETIHQVRIFFAACHDMIMDKLPSGRYQSIVATKLEEAAMFATKAITHTPPQIVEGIATNTPQA